MDEYRILSKRVYQIEEGIVQKNEKVKGTNHIVIDTIDTNKDTLKMEYFPRNNSMQAMTVAEIKDEFKSYKENKLKEIEGYPQSVVKKELTIVYAGTSGLKDWTTDAIEIGMNAKYNNGSFSSAVDYAREIEVKYPKEAGFTIGTSGHSLGGAEAIYVAVSLGYNAITYGAAGSGLTEAQIKNYKGTIVNLYDTSDIVTSGWMTGGQENIPFLSIGIDNEGWETFGHSLDQFEVDKKGNYLNKYGDIVIYSDLTGGISIEQTLLAQQIVQNKHNIRGVETYDGTNPHSIAEIKRLKAENKWLQAQIDSFTQLNGLR
ncbi:triacylglycerol lipase, partial [Enterococcus faecalis]